MGDWYGFEIRVIDGREVSGFSYQNENTGWNEVFVEMTDDQKAYANEWELRVAKLTKEMESEIKGWIK